ncbi:MAG: methylated-DNA--[protein]-cysteine S-methyltransferase [Pirellulales bacterium]
MSTATLTRRRPPTSPSGRPATAADTTTANREIVVFSSELGWMAAIVRRDNDRRDVLCELTFGHASPQAAVRRLAAAGDAAATQRQPALVGVLQAFARGEPVDLNQISIDLGELPPFAQRVVEHCRQIPYGQTLTYSDLAAQAGSPRAARAVGNVMRTNRIPLVVPCHRVVPRGSGLGGYSAPGGVRAKLRLLELEGNR